GRGSGANASACTSASATANQAIHRREPATKSTARNESSANADERGVSTGARSTVEAATTRRPESSNSPLDAGGDRRRRTSSVKRHVPRTSRDIWIVSQRNARFPLASAASSATANTSAS